MRVSNLTNLTLVRVCLQVPGTEECVGVKALWQEIKDAWLRAKTSGEGTLFHKMGLATYHEPTSTFCLAKLVAEHDTEFQWPSGLWFRKEWGHVLTKPRVNPNKFNRLVRRVEQHVDGFEWVSWYSP